MGGHSWRHSTLPMLPWMQAAEPGWMEDQVLEVTATIGTSTSPVVFRASWQTGQSVTWSSSPTFWPPGCGIGTGTHTPYHFSLIMNLAGTCWRVAGQEILADYKLSDYWWRNSSPATSEFRPRGSQPRTTWSLMPYLDSAQPGKLEVFTNYCRGYGVVPTRLEIPQEFFSLQSRISAGPI